MTETKKADTYWNRTKAWVKRNPTVSGAIAGGTAGSIVPGVGTVIGAIGGAVVAHYAAQDVEGERKHKVAKRLGKEPEDDPDTT